MKKTFRSILAGAVALLAVSCYDDSALRKQNELLKDQLNDLKESLVDASEFGIDRDELFLMYSAEKSLNLIAEGVAEYSVMNEPDGWQATIEGTTLKIVAPAKEAYDHGAAALKGEISIHATSNTGACKVAKIAVESGAGLRLNIDNEGNVTIKNAYATGAGFTTFAYGIMPASEWLGFSEQFAMMFGDMSLATMSIDELWAEYPDYVPYMLQYYADYYFNVGESDKPYEEGVNEVDVINTTVSAFFESYYYNPEVPYGTYIIFAANLDSKGIPADGIVTEEYFNTAFDLQVDQISHNEVTFNVNAQGADYYYVCAVPAARYANMLTFDNFMKDSNEGVWTGFTGYGADYSMGQIMETVPTTLKLSELFLDPDVVLHNMTYHVWVMPAYDLMTNKKTDSYGDVVYDFSAYDYETNFKPYCIEVKTADVKTGGPETVFGAETPDWKSVAAEITLTEGQMAYYKFVTSEEYIAFGGDDAKMKEAIMAEVVDVMSASRPNPVLTATETVSYNVDYGATDPTYLIAFTFSADGKAGECGVKSLLPKSLVRDSDISVKLTSLTKSESNYVVEFEVANATNVCLYNISADATDNNAYNISYGEQSIATGRGATVQKATVSEGKATVTFPVNDRKADIFVWAYTVDSNGQVDKIITTPIVHNIEAELAKNAQ